MSWIIRIAAFLMNLSGFGEAAFRLWNSHMDKVAGRNAQELTDLKASAQVALDMAQASELAPQTRQEIKDTLTHGKL